MNSTDILVLKIIIIIFGTLPLAILTLPMSDFYSGTLGGIWALYINDLVNRLHKRGDAEATDPTPGEA